MVITAEAVIAALGTDSGVIDGKITCITYQDTILTGIDGERPGAADGQYLTCIKTGFRARTLNLVLANQRDGQVGNT